MTPKEYDLAEALARDTLPNRAIQAFEPYAFPRLNYPTRVSFPMGLWRYADVMQEFRADKDMAERLGGLTQAERGAIIAVALRVKEITTAGGGQVVVPRAALFRAVSVWRHLRSLYPKPASPRVLEIGPGSGYLGWLLSKDGFQYAGVECTQGFYLWQHYLWRDRVEHAVEQGPISFSERIAHVPWWRYADVPEFDVMTCNHVLNEMHLYASSYWIRRAADCDAVIAFEGWGGVPEQNKHVTETLKRHGFRCAHEDNKITVLSRRPMKAPQLIQDGRVASGLYIHYVNSLDNFYQEHCGVALTPDEQFMQYVQPGQ